MKIFSRQRIGLVLGPLLFSIILFIPDLTGLSHAPRAVLAVTGWTAVWWVTEAILPRVPGTHTNRTLFRQFKSTRLLGLVV